MEIDLKAGIVLCVNFCKGEDIGVNSFIRKLDAKIISELLAIENVNLFKHNINNYNIVSEKDVLKVTSEEHEFEVEKELLRKLYKHLTELQDSIDELCSSKCFTYQYPLVNKDKSIADISLDPDNDEKQLTFINIKNANDSGAAMGEDEPLNISRGQNILSSPITTTTPAPNITGLDQFKYVTPININQTGTSMNANDSGYVSHVRMSGDEYDNFTIPPMLSHEPKNEEVSSGQNILPSPILAISSVSSTSSLYQSNKKPSTSFTVAMEGNLPSTSDNFEDEFFSTPSKAKCNWKALLQETLAKFSVNSVLPKYSCEEEGIGQGFSGSVEVTVLGKVLNYRSPVPLKTKKNAEQAAAAIAIEALKEFRVGRGGVVDSEQEDIKKLLYWHQSKLLPEPTYTYSVVTCPDDSLVTCPDLIMFRCTVTYNRNITIEGPVEKNKMSAKKKAASMAWKAIDN